MLIFSIKVLNEIGSNSPIQIEKKKSSSKKTTITKQRFDEETEEDNNGNKEKEEGPIITFFSKVSSGNSLQFNARIVVSVIVVSIVKTTCLRDFALT